MKIAIQIFGHLRTYKKCYKSLHQHLLNMNDCDVFIHTWDTIDHSTDTWHTFKSAETGQTSKDLQKDLERVYKPKAFKIEKQIIKDEGTIDSQGKKISIFGMHSMLRSMAQANKLREDYEKKNNVKYDYVLFIRPDIFLHEHFDIATYAGNVNDKYHIASAEKNVLYTAGFYKFSNTLNDFKYIGATDLLFFACPDTMSKIFKNQDTIFKQLKNEKTSKYGPEYSFVCAIQNLNIDVILLNYLRDKSYTILRGNDIRNIEAMPMKKIKTKHLINKFIRLHLRRRKLHFWLLSRIGLPNIIEMQLRILNYFIIDFSIGERQ